jgi:glycosyltransferase involved in cell wall biosynthesis
MDVSVLVATYRRSALLARTLESFSALHTPGLDWELLVVDNADDAATRSVAAAAGRLPLRLLGEPRRGKNHALNRALPEARGALVVFTDDDVIAEPGWLLELWRGSRRWPERHVFGGRIRPKWPRGAVPPPAHPFLDHAYGVADFDVPEGTYSAGRVYGANMAIRASIFRQGWTFDPGVGPDGTDTYIPGSESSLTVALERAGISATFLPRALVHHVLRPEQLTLGWLYRRAFRKGRADALRRGLGGGRGDASAGLRAPVLRAYCRWTRARLAGDIEGTLDHGIAYWHARGVARQRRMER